MENPPSGLYANPKFGTFPFKEPTGCCRGTATDRALVAHGHPVEVQRAVDEDWKLKVG
jgi:hypothetical protein